MTDLLTYVNNGFAPSDASPRKAMKGLTEGEPRWRTDYGYWYAKSGNGVMRPVDDALGLRYEHRHTVMAGSGKK